MSSGGAETVGCISGPLTRLNCIEITLSFYCILTAVSVLIVLPLPAVSLSHATHFDDLLIFLTDFAMIVQELKLAPLTFDLQHTSDD